MIVPNIKDKYYYTIHDKYPFKLPSSYYFWNKCIKRKLFFFIKDFRSRLQNTNCLNMEEIIRQICNSIYFRLRFGLVDSNNAYSNLKIRFVWGNSYP